MFQFSGSITSGHWHTGVPEEKLNRTYLCELSTSLASRDPATLPGILHDEVIRPQGQKQTDWEAHYSRDIYYYQYITFSFIFHRQTFKKNSYF
jgi:hypothetical protein